MKLFISRFMPTPALDTLRSPVLFQELEFLFRSESIAPAQGGVSGMEQAWLLGVMAMNLGYRCRLKSGTAALICGSGSERMLQIPGHAWLEIVHDGIWDLSLRTQHFPGSHWRSWALRGIASGSLLGQGSLMVTDNGEYFEHHCKRTQQQQSPARRVLLLEESTSAFNEEILEHPQQMLRSPLAAELLGRHGAPIFAAAAYHLMRLIEGATTSLTDLSRKQAWDYLAAHAMGSQAWIARLSKPLRAA